MSRLADAEEKFRSLCGLGATLQFPHYRVPISDMAVLRLAQTHDLQKRRTLAIAQYDILLAECRIPEIRQQAEAGKSRPFSLSNLPSEIARDIREYNLALSRFRETMPRDSSGL
jgi:hypothetical protein